MSCKIISNMAGISTGPAVVVQEHPSISTSLITETLTLRLVPRRKKKSVKWTEETVDNEFAGKKSSKKCCIFHRRRQFGDWSDDDDSDQECGDNCDQHDKGQGQSGQQQASQQGGSKAEEPVAGP